MTRAPGRRPTASRNFPERNSSGSDPTAPMVSARATCPSVRPRSPTANSFHQVMAFWVFT